MAKCTLCVDRVSVGLEPAASRPARPGASIRDQGRHAGHGHQRVEQLKGPGSSGALYDPDGVGGTRRHHGAGHGDHPEWYGLPRDPHVPLLVKFWKSVLRPLGVVAIFGAVIGLRPLHEPRTQGSQGSAAQDANLPDESPKGEPE
jgi:hypothetical protein